MMDSEDDELEPGEEAPAAEQVPEYTVTIEGPGTKITKSIGADQMLTIMSIALGTVPLPIGAQSGVARGPGAGASGRGQPAMSISEFVIESGARTIPQKMAAMVAYTKDHVGRDQVGRDEFKQLFQKASEAVPKNITRDLRLAMDQRWLASSHEDESQVYLTGTGRKAVTQGFDTDGGTPRRTARRRTRRAAAKPKPTSAE